MNKKLFRTVFAVFLAVFMCGTSVNPAVFAIDDEPETQNEGTEPQDEESDDTKNVIAEFVLGNLIPEEVTGVDDETLPGKLPAKLDGDAEDADPTDVAVEWTEKENTLTVDLADDSYTLSEKAEDQLKDISVSVKKTETEEKNEEVAPAEETGSDEPETQPETKEGEKSEETQEQTGDTTEESKETTEDQLNETLEVKRATRDANNGTLANGNITGDDDLDESDSQQEAVNAKLVVGKGHEDFAEKLLNKLQGDTGYAFREQFSLSSDKTEINLVIPNTTKVGELQYDLDTDAGNCTVEPPMLPEEYLSYAIIAQRDSLDFYEDEYDDIRDSEAEMDNENPIESGQTYYVLWKKPIEKINILVDTPICGTIIEFAEYSRFPKEESEQPNVTIQEGADVITIKKAPAWDDEEATWVDKEERIWTVIQPGAPFPVRFEGTITGGEQYIAEMEFDVYFKYYIKDGFTKVLVNNEESEQYEPSNTNLTVYETIKAEHDWGDWEVIKEPSFTEKGEEARKCKNPDCDAIGERKEIPTVIYSVKTGDGQTWSKGSTGTADFEFTRSWEDESQKLTAYDMFTEVDIDGKKVTDFIKAKGSVITKINASYMNTLSAGSHTITAHFSDKGYATATFTVKDKAASGGSSSDKTPTKPVDNVVTCQMAGYPSNYSWNESAKACQPGYIDAGGTFHPYRTPSRIIPNTSDRDIMIHAWIAMLSITIGLFCGVKLLHEDWEV